MIWILIPGMEFYQAFYRTLQEMAYACAKFSTHFHEVLPEMKAYRANHCQRHLRVLRVFGNLFSKIVVKIPPYQSPYIGAPLMFTYEP